VTEATGRLGEGGGEEGRGRQGGVGGFGWGKEGETLGRSGPGGGRVGVSGGTGAWGGGGGGGASVWGWGGGGDAREWDGGVGGGGGGPGGGRRGRGGGGGGGGGGCARGNLVDCGGWGGVSGSGAAGWGGGGVGGGGGGARAALLVNAGGGGGGWDSRVPNRGRRLPRNPRRPESRHAPRRRVRPRRAPGTHNGASQTGGGCRPEDEPGLGPITRVCRPGCGTVFPAGSGPQDENLGRSWLAAPRQRWSRLGVGCGAREVCVGFLCCGVFIVGKKAGVEPRRGGVAGVLIFFCVGFF
jgi:hypothetical protein